MIKDYLKKLRGALVENIERIDDINLIQNDVRMKLDDMSGTIFDNLKQNIKIGNITEDDIKRMAEGLTVYLFNKEDVRENLKNVFPMAPFNVDENGEIVLVEDNCFRQR